LVRNLTPRGGTGKLRSYWEEKVHVVVDKRDDIPIYKVKSEDGVGKVRVLHRNLLKECNDLQKEEVPEKGKNKLTTTEKKDKIQNSNNDVELSDDTDEENEVMAYRLWKNLIDSPSQSTNKLRQNHAMTQLDASHQMEEMQEEIQPDVQSESEDHEEADQNHAPNEMEAIQEVQSEVEDNDHNLMPLKRVIDLPEAPQVDVPSPSPLEIIQPSAQELLDDIEVEDAPSSDSDVPEPPRRSKRERKPAQRFTYDDFGQPSIKPIRNMRNWLNESKEAL